MLLFSSENQEHLLEWAATRCGNPVLEEVSSAHAISACQKDGTIRAVAVYIPLVNGEVECHFATDGTKRWATRQALSLFCAWPFVYMGAERLICTVDVANTDIIVLCIKTGWQIEARLRRAMPDGADGIILTMDRDECRWIEKTGEI